MFAKVFIPTDLSDASAAVAERVGEVPGVREVVLFHARTAAGPSPADDVLRRMQEWYSNMASPPRWCWRRTTGRLSRRGYSGPPPRWA